MLSLSIIDFFDINKTLFIAPLSYKISYLELIATLMGLFATLGATKEYVWSWILGAMAVILLFFLFYQIRLYADMALQIFFLITNLMGWWRWLHPKKGEENYKKQLRISRLDLTQWLLLLLCLIPSIYLCGWITARVHLWFPIVFKTSSDYPFADAFTTVTSMCATFLMINKKIENWIIWFIIDVVAAYMYFKKGVFFLSLEYMIFCFMAIYGYLRWRNILRKNMRLDSRSSTKA